MKQIPLFKVYMSKEAITSITQVLESGYIGQGLVVEEFERELQSWLKVSRLLTLNSATSAEHLAIYMSKQDGYKEVLASPLTCTASNTPIVTNRLDIKWVDIDSKTLNIDLDDFARKITPQTGMAMIPLWGGIPIDVKKLGEIVDRAHDELGIDVQVIVDCAHGFGSTVNGVNISAYWGSEVIPFIYTYSTQAIKHLTSIEGGILVTHSEEFYRRAKLLRWYGLDRDTDAKDFRCGQRTEEWGFKFNQTDPNAAVGLANLKHINSVLGTHRRNAAYYQRELKDVPGLVCLEVPANTNPAWWVYTILVENRDGFIKMMADKGITTSLVHERNDRYPATIRFASNLPTLESINDRRVCIPVGWWVTEDDAQYIVKSIKEGW